jgi:hypothetical protein
VISIPGKQKDPSRPTDNFCFFFPFPPFFLFLVSFSAFLLISGKSEVVNREVQGTFGY